MRDGSINRQANPARPALEREAGRCPPRDAMLISSLYIFICIYIYIYSVCVCAYIHMLYTLVATIAGFILQLPATRVRARPKMADYDNLLTSPASRFRRTCWKAPAPADRLETRKHLRSSGKPLVSPRESALARRAQRPAAT